jgi:PAB1-binding protein PBP1
MYTQLSSKKKSSQLPKHLSHQQERRKESLEPTNLGTNNPSKNAAKRVFMNTVIFNARGLLPIVMTWNKDEQNMGARPMAGHSRCEIKPQGRRRAKAGMKEKMDMRRSWRWGSFGGGWWAMVVGGM